MRSLIEASERPVLLLGGEAYGVPFLIERLRRDGRLAWMRASPRDRGDAVAQGNLLARALNRAIGGELFPAALPYAYGVRALRHYGSELGPLTVALSEAQHVPELAVALAKVHGGGIRVVFDSPETLELPGCCVLGPEDMALTLAEAREMSPRGLNDEELQKIWRRAAGRMVDVLTHGLRAVDMPLPTLPTPDGRLLPPSEARGEEPRRVVQALVRERRVVEALELAVLAMPEGVEDLLRTAGPQFQEQGLLARLGLLLAALPEPHARGETVLEWRLVAGFATGDVADVLPAVDAHLEAFASPRLRARRAGLLPPEQALAMAREAAEARRDALTLFQLGRYEPDDDSATDLLLESVRRAEGEGGPYEVVRNGGALGERYLAAGRLDEAVTWLSWAYDLFVHERLQDGNRRLRLLNDLAMARILLGDAAAVRAALEETQESLEGVLPLLALTFRSTLASLATLRGRTDEARELLASIRAAAPRNVRAHFSVPWVLLLLRSGETGAARDASERTGVLSRADGSAYRAPALLLRGLVAAAEGQDGAADLLRRAAAHPALVLEHGLAAGLALLNVGGRPADLPDRIRRAALRVPDATLELLSMSDAASRTARAALRGERAPLVLEVANAGRPRARLEGREVELSGRLWEVALMLALHPGGLDDEALLDALVGESASFGRSALRTHVSRLRTVLPVTGTPYRFAVPYEVDVLTARELVAERRVREALARTPGDVLRSSTMPGVEAFRREFDEELRQAVLASGDPEALLEVAHRSRDDLEVWEAALSALGDGDPRRPLAKARVLRLAREYDLDPERGDVVR